MDISITKEAKKTIKDIVKVYDARIKDGISKGQAVQFSETDSDHELFDYDDLCELDEADLISMDVDGGFNLENSGIIYVESLLTDSLLMAVDIVSKLKP